MRGGMRGLMQDHPLLVTQILDYAARFHGEQVRARLVGARVQCARRPSLGIVCPVKCERVLAILASSRCLSSLRLKESGLRAGTRVEHSRGASRDLHVSECTSESSTVCVGLAKAGGRVRTGLESLH